MSTNRLYTYCSQVRDKEIGKDKEVKRRGIGRGMRQEREIQKEKEGGVEEGNDNEEGKERKKGKMRRSKR